MGDVKLLDSCRFEGRRQDEVCEVVKWGELKCGGVM